MVQTVSCADLGQRYRYQIFATAAIQIMAFAHGNVVGWISPALLLLQSDDSPFGEPVTVSEVSWIASIVGFGLLFGNILFGFLLDRIGRKWCMYLMALPNLIFWILVYCSQNAGYLIAGRFLEGITSSGTYVVTPVFISEIADTSIRGALGSSTGFYSAIGIIIGGVIATFLSYRTMPYIMIAVPIIYLLATFGLLETPQYLFKRGREAKAEESYRFYKNMSRNRRSEIHGVVSEKELTDTAEFETFKSELLKGKIVQPVSAADFVTPEALKTFAIILVLMITSEFSGCYAVFNFSSQIFDEMGNKIPPNICTLIVNSVQIVATCVTIVLVDRVGRRVLLLSATVGMGVCMLGIGFYIQFGTDAFFDKYDWVPLLLMCLLQFISSVGMRPLVAVITVELVPAKIRSLGTSFSMAAMSIFIFISLKIFPLLLFDLGIPITMYITTGFCCFGFITLGIFLPETKSKSMLE